MRKFKTPLVVFVCALLGFPLVLMADVARLAPTGAAVVLVSGVSEATLTTFNVPSGATCLIASLHSQTGNLVVSTMNWDNAGTPQAMTAIASAVATSSGGNIQVRLYYLANPTVGTLHLFADWASNRTAALGAIAFSGSGAGAGCFNDANTVSAIGSSSTPQTGNVNGSATGLTIGAVTHGNNVTATSTQTSQYRSGGFAMSYSAVGVGPNDHVWAGSSGDYAAVGLNIVVPAVSCNRSSRLLLGVGGC